MDDLIESLLPETCTLHFKKRREILNLDIATVVSRLKIHEKYIHALENNEIPKGLPFVFLKGYIKLYSQLLAIPEVQLQIALRELEEKHKDFFQKPQVQPTSQKIRFKPNRKWTSIFTTLFFVSLFSLSFSTLLTGQSARLQFAAADWFTKQKPLEQIKRFAKTHFQV